MKERREQGKAIEIATERVKVNKDNSRVGYEAINAA
jgi:hypothetical protein